MDTTGSVTYKKVKPTGKVKDGVCSLFKQVIMKRLAMFQKAVKTEATMEITSISIFQGFTAGNGNVKNIMYLS
jgi:hypothetical protein